MTVRAVLRNQLNSGFSEGSEAAMMPIVSSRKFQTLKESWTDQSRSSKMRHCWTAFMMAAAQANQPSERTTMREILVRALIWSRQIKGMGSVAKRTSVTMLNACLC